MQWLIIKPTSLEAKKADYALLEQKSEQASFTLSNWAAIKDHIGNCRVVLLIPSEEVSLHQVALPMANNKQMVKAIPYALEDSLAENIEALHFSFYREHADSDVNVAAINIQRLRQWYDTAQQEWKIRPHIILPDFFALPANETTSSLLVNSERSLYRYNSFLGISCNSDLLPLLLPSFMGDTGDTSDTEESASSPTLLLEKPDELELDLPEQLHIEKTLLHNSCHRSLLAALPLNLLTGFGQNEQQTLLKNLSKWKAAIILVGLIASLWVISTSMQNYRSQQHLQQLNQAIINVYKDTLPNATVDSDYRVNHQIIEEKLKALGVAAPTIASPLEPLALITPILKKAKNISLKKLSIDNNQLILAITTDSVTQLERFHETINRNATLQAEIKSQNSSGNKVVATLHINKKKQ